MTRSTEMTQSIHITIPHSLPQAVAFDRVLSWLNAQSGKPQSFATVTPLETTVYHNQFKLFTKITLTVLGHEETHTLTFAAEPSTFRVTSDFSDSMIEAGEMAIEQMQLQKQLTEVLKS